MAHPLLSDKYLDFPRLRFHSGTHLGKSLGESVGVLAAGLSEPGLTSAPALYLLGGIAYNLRCVVPRLHHNVGYAHGK